MEAINEGSVRSPLAGRVAKLMTTTRSASGNASDEASAPDFAPATPAAAKWSAADFSCPASDDS